MPPSLHTFAFESWQETNRFFETSIYLQGPIARHAQFYVKVITSLST